MTVTILRNGKLCYIMLHYAVHEHRSRWRVVTTVLKRELTQKESLSHSGRLEEVSVIDLRRFEGMCSLSSSEITESEKKFGNQYPGSST